MIECPLAVTKLTWVSVYGYITECHRNKAPEAFAALNLRNIYSFGMNYFISSWISTQGPLQVFSTIGGLHIVSR